MTMVLDTFTLGHCGAASERSELMGQIFREFLSGNRIYCCSNCHSHAADHEEVVSKHFQGRYGRAYLFNKVVNVCLGPKEERMLITGRHTVSDIYCTICQQVLGWKYDTAHEEAEKYKEGKFIIEKKKMTKENW